LPALILGLLLASLLPPPVSAHAELVRSNPAAQSINPTGVQQVDLWFSEPVQWDRSHVWVKDKQGQQVDMGSYFLDPTDHRHVITPLAPSLKAGTYTVTWRSYSPDDGHILTGSFTFRVGLAQVPGAASTLDAHPSPLAVVLRWTVLLGLATVAGWFLLGVLGMPLGGTPRWLAVTGIVAALIADLALLPVQIYAPAGGLPTSSLQQSVADMSVSWFVRLALEVVLLIVLTRPLLRLRGLAGVLGAFLAAGSLLTLTFTSHAANADRQLLTMATNALHLEAVALWLGGLAQLALLPTLRRSGDGKLLRRFSRGAIILAPLALLTGLANAGLTLPSVGSLWQSEYGWILLIKSGIVLGILGLAWVNRRAVQAGWIRVQQFARSLRLEVLLASLALLAAALLALSAPPISALQQPKQQPLHLVSTISRNRVLHLVISPADSGRNRLLTWVADQQDRILLDVQPPTVQLSMLEYPVDLPTRQPARQADGRFALDGVPLNGQGWWKAEIEFAGSQTSQTYPAEFFWLIPDPTLVGDVRGRPTDPQASHLFHDAIERFKQLSSVRAQQTLTDGLGHQEETVFTYAVPNQLSYSSANGYDSVVLGHDEYDRHPGGSWEHSTRPKAFAFPDSLLQDYQGPEQFMLGRQADVAGERCQIITFQLPRQHLWYAWWVGSQSSLIRREVMIGEYHYMVTDFTDFDRPVQVTTPVLH
jgi:copper transport protein